MDVEGRPIEQASGWKSALVHASPDFVALVDRADGRLSFLNPTALQWLAASPGTEFRYQDLGQSLWSGEESARLAVEGWKTALASGESAWETRALDRATNDERSVVCRLLRVDDSLVLTLRDVTDLRAAEKTASEIGEEFKNFAYLVSHDLKEPLRMISSYLQLIRKRMPGTGGEANSQEGLGSVDEFMAFAVDGAKRMGVLLDALLQYSRIDAGPGDFEWAEADVCLTRALGSVDLALQEAQGQVAREALPRVFTVPKLLTSVFQHVLANAIRFRSEDPVRIEVRAVDGGPHWTFSIRDNGIGIAPSDTTRAFSVFQKLPEGRSPGLGMGLALTKKTVSRLGGRIWIDSRPGEGTTVLFTLPKRATAL